MKYKGKELVEMTQENWDGKSRRMLAWRDDYKPWLTMICGYNPLSKSWICADSSIGFSHCAEIPKEETNQVQSTDEMIEILNAYKKGKKIECRFKDRTMRDSWSCIEKPNWNWDSYEYRIKQEPRRMTNKELKEWLKKNCGQYCIPSNSFVDLHVKAQFGYGIGKDDEFVKEGIQIRAWYESEWHEPLIEE
ncbi:MAG: hypothetical protein MJZ34_08400 [Paludibacteraceae bacterium]|nr:hypothetical protein [Paludibacteraceae bacterium]